MKKYLSLLFVMLKGLLLLMAMVEGIYGVLQLLGVLHSSHSQYPITGTFFNPGPYACYLALTFPLALSIFVSKKSRWMQIAGGVVLLLDAVLLPLTMSRTAWLAALIGSLFVFQDYWRGLSVNRKILSAVSLLILCIAIGTGAYRMKQDSADGRFLMWKVACRAIATHPFTGAGWDCVAGKYGDAQELYFEEGNGSDREIMVADAPDYVFNEYLQVAIAYGWGWSAAMILLLGSAIALALINRRGEISGCLISAMIVMMASYPLQFGIFTFSTGILLVVAFMSARRIDMRLTGVTASIAACALLLTNQPEHDKHSLFNIGHYRHQAGEWRRSNEVLLDMLPHSSDPMPLNIIGKNYRELGMPDSAEHYFRRAANRCPNRLYPHYLLMKLHSDSLSADRLKALEEAKIILTQKEKILSPAVEEMRRDAQRIIDETPTLTPNE